ncbi:hypothetical protein GIB67_037468, partial [Kingdonia uniflora]
KGLSTIKDTDSSIGLSTTKAGGPLGHNSFPDPKLEYRAKFRLSQSRIGEDLRDFQFKSVVYTEDPYDFSKEFNIGDLYQDKIELKNHIRAYGSYKQVQSRTRFATNIKNCGTLQRS